MSDLYSSQLKSSQVTHGALQPVSHGKLDGLRFIKLHARQPLALAIARGARARHPACSRPSGRLGVCCGHVSARFGACTCVFSGCLDTARHDKITVRVRPIAIHCAAPW